METRTTELLSPEGRRLSLDGEIASMASLRMGDAVHAAEGRMPRIGYPGYARNAAQHLVCQMFTDAVFNQDIRTIQTIINRIDGGLPKDCEIEDFQTLFGDCMAEVLSMESQMQTKVTPDDTVMMALCKSLYDLAVQDIYFDPATGKRCKPSTEKKQERDSALRMVLERAGGRKTTPQIEKSVEEIGDADWLSEVLPAPQEDQETCPDQEIPDKQVLT